MKRHRGTNTLELMLIKLQLWTDTWVNVQSCGYSTIRGLISYNICYQSFINIINTKIWKSTNNSYQTMNLCIYMLSIKYLENNIFIENVIFCISYYFLAFKRRHKIKLKCIYCFRKLCNTDMTFNTIFDLAVI